MAVDKTADFSIEYFSQGSTSLGNGIAAHTVVGVTPNVVGLWTLRAYRLGSYCTLSETVYPLPSLGTVSVSGTLYTFTDLTLSVTSTGGVSPRTYDWDFDDGNTEDDGGTSVVHQYEAAGTYVVSVDLTDTNGRTDTANKTIVVAANPNVPGAPGAAYEDWLGCYGSAHYDIDWSAPTTGATASTYRFNISGGGWSDTYWNSTTNVDEWLSPSTNYTVNVRACTSQSEATCGPTETHSFTSHSCQGDED